MERSELAGQIKAAFDSAEWEKLEKGTLDVPVSDHNRETLLGLKKRRRRFSGEVRTEEVEALQLAVEDFLSETWPECPAAHKYVTCACLVQTFLDEVPMHPQKAVKYYITVEEGEQIFYCPQKGDNVICGLCKARSCRSLFREREEKTSQISAGFGEKSARIRRQILETGFLDSGVIPTGELLFHEEVRGLCEKNQCRCYGTTWACPPAVGSLEECRARVLRYQYMQLFSKSYYIQNSMDLKRIGTLMHDFKKEVSELDRRLKNSGGHFLLLSNESCDRCVRCTYPDAPCRFPEDLHHSIEGYGFYVLELARAAGIRYINGNSTVTFFGAVLYDG